MIHFDTNILIEISHRIQSTLDYVGGLLDAGKPIAASSIAWMEFSCGNNVSEDEQYAILNILNHSIHPFNQEQAVIAAKLFHKTGRKRGSQGDCMIAATAIHHNSSIATRNLKDFEKFTPLGLNLETLPPNPLKPC
jgi:predicted nucleic acid-binding protein